MTKKDELAEKLEKLDKLEKLEQIEIDKIEDIKDDEIMTIGEVAAYFKLSEQIIIKLVKDGEMPSFRIGEHYRIKKSDVGNFIDELMHGRRV